MSHQYFAKNVFSANTWKW